MEISELLEYLENELEDYEIYDEYSSDAARKATLEEIYDLINRVP